MTKDSSDIKRMDILEFQEEGYLQELNRQFLHPHGLALEIICDIDDEDGTRSNFRLGGVWDFRDDPEGMYFGVEEDGSLELEPKANRVNELAANRAWERWNRLGFWVQPVKEPEE